MKNFEPSAGQRSPLHEINNLSGEILDCCISVHKEYGAGFLESVYEACLMKEFELRGIKAERQRKVPVIYKGHYLNKDFILIYW
jgi:GxxExxY protein